MKINIYILIIFLTFSCINKNTDNKKEALNLIFINKISDNTIELNNVFNNFSFIKLESNENSLFSTAIKLVFYKDRIYILQKRPKNIILIFNKNGRFVNTIQNFGKGPEEYLSMIDICYDKYNDRLTGLDNTKGKFFHYSKDGNLLAIAPSKKGVQSFLPLDNGIIYYYDNYVSTKNKYLLEIIDNNKSTFAIPSKKYFPYLNVTDPWNFFSNDDSNFFLYAFCNTIYSVNNKQLQKAYYIDFGTQSLDESIFNQKFRDIREFVKACNNSQKAYMVSNFIKLNSDTIFFSFFKNKQKYFVFYDTKNQKNTIGNKFVLQVFNEKWEFTQVPVGFYKNSMIFLIDTFELIEKIKNFKNKASFSEWEQFKTIHSDLYDIYITSNEMDNPTLMYCKKI